MYRNFNSSLCELRIKTWLILNTEYIYLGADSIFIMIIIMIMHPTNVPIPPSRHYFIYNNNNKVWIKENERETKKPKERNWTDIKQRRRNRDNRPTKRQCSICGWFDFARDFKLLFLFMISYCHSLKTTSFYSLQTHISKFNVYAKRMKKKLQSRVTNALKN